MDSFLTFIYIMFILASLGVWWGFWLLKDKPKKEKKHYIVKKYEKIYPEDQSHNVWYIAECKCGFKYPSVFTDGVISHMKEHIKTEKRRA